MICPVYKTEMTTGDAQWYATEPDAYLKYKKRRIEIDGLICPISGIPLINGDLTDYMADPKLFFQQRREENVMITKREILALIKKEQMCPVKNIPMSAVDILEYDIDPEDYIRKKNNLKL